MKDEDTCAQLTMLSQELGIMGNANDPPAHTINLEFSDEKHAFTK